MSDRPSFFSELKRRNVIRVAGLYLVGAWLLIQVASTVLPTFEAPSWALRGLIITLALGFIPALIFSWVFELTPQGLKRDEDVAPEQSIAPQTARRMDRMIIAVLVLALAYFGFDKFVLAPRREAALVAQSHAAPAPNESQPPASAKSIAVLPFENLSEDKANAYFAEGIQEEILTRLAKIADLKVISRTSTQQYQSKPGNLSAIAKQLGVANILEGSVQKSADQVRINVQLINAQRDSHLWAETYDRKLTDVFAVESEVAERIAGSLEAKLTGSEQRAIATKPTSNQEAYDAYLHGLAAERRSELSAESIQNSSRFYREAVQLDPRFALAWARLAIGESNFYFNSYDRTPQRLAAAREAAETAFKLRPDLGETLLADGYYQYYGLADYPAARKAFEEARRLLPNSADVLLAISYIDRRQGQWQDALAHQEEAIPFDPRNPVVYAETSLTYLWQGKYAEARKSIDRALDLAPGDAELVARKAASYQAEGNLAAADNLLASLPLQPNDKDIFITQMQQLLYRRRYQLVIAALEKALANPPPFLGQNIGFYYVLLGLAQERAGNPQAARATYREGREKLEKLRQNDGASKELVAGLAFMYAGLGERALALREMQKLAEQTARNAVMTNAVQTTLAKVQTQLGDIDPALASLPHLLGRSGADWFSRTPPTADLLRLDPIWDPLRNDPRFQKLINDRDAVK